jgi:beta-glucosidase
MRKSAQLVDLRGHLNAIGALVFDTIVRQSPQGAVKMRVDCRYPCVCEVDATKLFKAMPLNVKQTVKIPLQCFAAAGTDFLRINTPILFYTEQAFVASFAEIRWVPGAARDADALTCDRLMP